ncbi:MAG: phosphatase PAP2 family protein [Chloroflexota bacterium]
MGRGFFSQHGTALGIRNAQQLVSFEAAHGFWVEPGWQLFFLQTRHIFTVTLTSLDMVHLMNVVYVLGHVFVTLSVALWVYFFRRKYFALLRNSIMLCNAFALVVYETFPVAPPRLTTGLSFNHHAFAFQDTVFGVLTAGGKLVGTGLGYNEFSAMPSVHMAWAMIAGGALVVLARPLAVRALGVAYPLCMLVAVVVTGNHFFLDVAGAIGVVVLAFGVSYAVSYYAAHWMGTQSWSPGLRQALFGET